MDILRIRYPEPITSTHDKPINYDMRYRPDHTKKPVIIFVHGFKGFKDWGYFDMMADHFAEAGFVFIKINLSHNGTTTEQPTEFVDLEAFGNNNFSKEMDDLGTIIDYIHAPDFSLPDPEFDQNKLFLIGHSRGGSLVLLKAKEDERVKGVVTMAAVTDLEKPWHESTLAAWKESGVHNIENSRTGQTMPLYYQIVDDYFQHRDRLNVQAALTDIQVPILAFHGTEDETVPITMVYDVERKNHQAKIEIVQGANHTFGGQHPYEEAVLPPAVEKIVEDSVAFFKTI